MERQYRRGLITEDEQYEQTLDVWTETKDRVTDAVTKSLDRVRLDLHDGRLGRHKGQFQQISQIAGMRGLMADPSGRIIDLPIRSNFREGLSVLEYFISTHGARKGLADTALRTADSGYLTRRLVDVAQTSSSTKRTAAPSPASGSASARRRAWARPWRERIVGRLAAAERGRPEDRRDHRRRGSRRSTRRAVRRINAAGLDQVLRPLSAYLPGHGRRLPLLLRARPGARPPGGAGEAVGIIAAQSIGEPGTQLTMRTFHTGGVAGTEDITQGLPRVEELFEARRPRARPSSPRSTASSRSSARTSSARCEIVSAEVYRDEYPLPEGYVGAGPTTARRWTAATTWR